MPFPRSFFLNHHSSFKAAIVRPVRGSHQLILTNGPRSEHSSPPRSVLAGPGGNSLSDEPEICLLCVPVPKILTFGSREGLCAMLGSEIRRGGWVGAFFYQRFTLGVANRL